MTRYRAGADLERAAKAELERAEFYVVKSGGSKGKADLVALGHQVGRRPWPLVLLVQCKTDGYLLPAERADLVLLAHRLGAVPMVARWEKTGREARRVGFRALQLDRALDRPWPGEGI